jgi:hypothetical protein
MNLLKICQFIILSSTLDHITAFKSIFRVLNNRNVTFNFSVAFKIQSVEITSKLYAAYENVLHYLIV